MLRDYNVLFITTSIYSSTDEINNNTTENSQLSFQKIAVRQSLISEITS